MIRRKYKTNKERKEIQSKLRKKHFKENYVCGSVAGKGFRIFTDGYTEILKKQLPEIKNKVLEDCIKNPRKYLKQEKKKSKVSKC